MRITVIGYWGGYPAPNGATSIYRIEKDGFNLVLDMGSGGLMKLQQCMDVTDIHAVILSHYHTDHIADVGVLQHALLVKALQGELDKPVPIYGHTEDRETFQTLNHQYTKAKVYREKETLKLGPFFIRFLKTKHPVPCYGMRITDGTSTVVYTADTAYQENWIPFSKDADLLIADSNFYADQHYPKAGHMTSVEAARIAKSANVGELLLSHLPQYGEQEKMITEAAEYYPGNINLAEEGWTWEK